MGEIVTQARRLVEAGVREIVLTGVDIGGYGGDLPGRPPLGQMVRRLLRQLPELPRLRLSSLDPVEIDEDLWRLIAEEPRLMPHLHLSLQAGDDLILKRMKRRHSRADAVAAAARARALRPGIALGADLIAGFPTETEAMFERSLALVEDCGLAFLHVFPYSARAGTPAARMPQLPMALRRERARAAARGGAAAEARFLDRQRGRLEQVLIERPGRGHGESFAEVETEGGLRRRDPGAAHHRHERPAPAGPTTARSAGCMTEKRGWLGRLAAGLKRSSSRLSEGIAGIFVKRRLDKADAGRARGSADRRRSRARHRRRSWWRSWAATASTRRSASRRSARSWPGSIAKLLEPVAKPLILDPAHKPFVVLVVGVNGSGKTTTIGKLAQFHREAGRRVVLAAGDTFRAAAVEQLKIWGERTGAHGRRAASRAPMRPGLPMTRWSQARAEGADLLLIDTAGRLHNKADLMAELAKIIRVLKKLDPTAPHECLLVLDATVGQNAHAAGRDLPAIWCR